MTVRTLVITRLSSAWLQIGDLIGRAADVEHLIEGDAVDRDRRVVPGDDLLTRHVDDLLHHVELAADRVDIGNDEPEARRQGLAIVAEPLDGVIVALRHLPHAHERGDDDKRHDDEREDACPFKHEFFSSAGAADLGIVHGAGRGAV